MSPSATRTTACRLRVAYILGAFSCVSQTFVRSQIIGISDRGHEVDVYTTATAAEVADEMRGGQRAPCIRPLSASPNRMVAVAQIAGLMLIFGWRAPRVMLKTFDEIRRQGLAGSARLLYAALTLIGRGRPRYDVIHGQFGEYGLLALQLTRVGAMRGPVVTSFRGYDVGKYLRAGPQIYAELFRSGRVFLPVSRTLAQYLVDAGCDTARIRVHPSGIDCGRIAYREPTVTREYVRLVTVARLVEKKGIAYAVRAVKQHIDAGRIVSYTIVGDGPLRRDLQRLIGALGLNSYVHLVGPRPYQVALQVIADSDILLAPSVTSADGDIEGIPNVVKEAMATGLPVIATDHGGMAELVEDGVSGFLVPERNPQALAERLGYLIEHRQLWAAMGKAGRDKVVADFDLARRNAELEQIYCSLSLFGSSLVAPDSTSSQPGFGHSVEGTQYTGAGTRDDIAALSAPPGERAAISAATGWGRVDA